MGPAFSRNCKTSVSFNGRMTQVTVVWSAKFKNMSTITFDAFSFTRKLRDAGFDEQQAEAAAASIKKEINEHCALHAAQLATKTDLTEAKAEIIKWSVGAMFGAVALFATITKLWT